MLPQVIELNTIPFTALPSPEADMLTQLEALITINGWTFMNQSTSGVLNGIRWFHSTGTSGLRNLVLGLGYSTTIGQLRPSIYCGSDISDGVAVLGPIGAGVADQAGYGNCDDTPGSVLTVAGVSAGPRYVQCFTNYWSARDAASPLEFWASANADRIQLRCAFVSAGLSAQGEIIAGVPRAILSRNLYRDARARVWSISHVAGTLGAADAVLEITLDRNITRTLKDQVTSPATDPFRSKIVFQAVAAGEAGAYAAGSGFAQYETIRIDAGTVSTDGSNRTVFRVTANGQKLFKANGLGVGVEHRYNRTAPSLGQKVNNGVGDIVSLCMEPMCISAQALNNGSAYDFHVSPGPGAAVAKSNSGQRAAEILAPGLVNSPVTPGSGSPTINIILANKGIASPPQNLPYAEASFNDPNPASNRGIPFARYISSTSASVAGLVGNVDSSANDIYGVWPDVIETPKFSGIPDGSVATRDGKDTERYKMQEFVSAQGLGAPSSQFGQVGAQEYQTGLRGQWI